MTYSASTFKYYFYTLIAMRAVMSSAERTKFIKLAKILQITIESLITDIWSDIDYARFEFISREIKVFRIYCMVHKLNLAKPSSNIFI